MKNHLDHEKAILPHPRSAQYLRAPRKQFPISFALLEKEQADFLAMESAFRSREYKWPRDPLHTWSRVWEYPYTYHHLQQARGQWPVAPPPRVVSLLPLSWKTLSCHRLARGVESDLFRIPILIGRLAEAVRQLCLS